MSREVCGICFCPYGDEGDCACQQAPATELREQQEPWVGLTDDERNMSEELKEAVKEFFNKYLNRVEESDSGYPFHPVTVSCCRALMLQPLGQLLEKMRELSEADKDTLKGYYDE